jgi:hypothetical protein
MTNQGSRLPCGAQPDDRRSRGGAASAPRTPTSRTCAGSCRKPGKRLVYSGRGSGATKLIVDPPASCRAAVSVSAQPRGVVLRSMGCWSIHLPGFCKARPDENGRDVAGLEPSKRPVPRGFRKQFQGIPVPSFRQGAQVYQPSRRRRRSCHVARWTLTAMPSGSK